MATTGPVPALSTLLTTLAGGPLLVGNVRVGLAAYAPATVGSSAPAGSASSLLGVAAVADGAAPPEGAAAPDGTAAVADAAAGEEAGAALVTPEEAEEDVKLPFEQPESTASRAAELTSTSGERRTRRPQAFLYGMYGVTTLA